MKIASFLLLCNLLLTGCYMNGLYVQEEWVDRDFLASTKVNTPDPRQEEPPTGHRLLVGWDLPRSLFLLHPKLHISIWLWDNHVEEIDAPIERRRGAEAYFFPNQKILTYRVDVIAPDGTILKTWEHHFWTQLIALDSFESAERRSDSVSSQPRHESVMETP